MVVVEAQAYLNKTFSLIRAQLNRENIRMYERSKEEGNLALIPYSLNRAPRGTWSSVNKCTNHLYYNDI